MTDEKLRMNAYYFGFTETKVRVVDEVLSAVACAGKAYHHTESWTDSQDGELSHAEEIQAAAERAADNMRALIQERDTALARVADLEDLVCAAAPLAWAVTMDQDAAQAWERRATGMVRAGTGETPGAKIDE